MAANECIAWKLQNVRRVRQGCKFRAGLAGDALWWGWARLQTAWYDTPVPSIPTMLELPVRDAEASRRHPLRTRLMRFRSFVFP
jgi:hypothetical protein